MAPFGWIDMRNLEIDTAMTDAQIAELNRQTDALLGLWGTRAFLDLAKTPVGSILVRRMRKEANCPNCAAPVVDYRCAYCGTLHYF